MSLTKKRQNRDTAGMTRFYETCPICGRIASSENIVRVDERKMCRDCMKTKAKAAKQRAVKQR